MNTEILTHLFNTIPLLASKHMPGQPIHNLLFSIAKAEIEKAFEAGRGQEINLGPFERLVFPYHKMGTIDSLNLFEIDELIILSFYWQNRHRYKSVLDLGANIGLHTIALKKIGYEVCSFEPDTVHFEILKENITLNNLSLDNIHRCAISEKDGETEFLRVLGNTTGSRIAAATRQPYGKIEKINVETRAFQPLLKNIDLVKMDVEGYEKFIISTTEKSDWIGTDGMLSIHDNENASAVYEHFKSIGINMFSQKTGWGLVSDLSDMPNSHHEGSLFVTAADKMHWLD